MILLFLSIHIRINFAVFLTSQGLARTSVNCWSFAKNKTGHRVINLSTRFSFPLCIDYMRTINEKWFSSSHSAYKKFVTSSQGYYVISCQNFPSPCKTTFYEYVLFSGNDFDLSSASGGLKQLARRKSLWQGWRKSGLKVFFWYINKHVFNNNCMARKS